MNADDNRKGNPCSGVPRLDEVPDFKSGIPPELVDKLDRKYQALFRAISVMEKMDDWTANNVLQHNRAIHRICAENEDLHRRIDSIMLNQKLTSAKWNIPIVVATIVGTVVLTRVCEKLLGTFLP